MQTADQKTSPCQCSRASGLHWLERMVGHWNDRRCKKCNRMLVPPYPCPWVVGIKYRQDMNGEAMEHTCGFCGYKWDEPCAEIGRAHV